jgi:hypothetical protein
MSRPTLTVAQILRWADAHRRRTGRWPTALHIVGQVLGGNRWQTSGGGP